MTTDIADPDVAELIERLSKLLFPTVQIQAIQDAINVLQRQAEELAEVRKELQAAKDRNDTAYKIGYSHGWKDAAISKGKP